MAPHEQQRQHQRDDRELARLDPEQLAIVEMRYFLGLTYNQLKDNKSAIAQFEDIAADTGTSQRSVQRWLNAYLDGELGEEEARRIEARAEQRIAILTLNRPAKLNAIDYATADALIALLTPVLGRENFSVEVNAVIDASESQATRESFRAKLRAGELDEAARLDPSLAIAYWGQALVLGPNINAVMEPNEEPHAYEMIQKAKALAGRGSLIPAERSYVEQLRRFEYQCAAAGAHRIHGHRHQYAQTRYRELTGWPAPAAGGPRSRDLTPSQREADREARLTISEELGHEREQITAVYLGR